MSACPWPCGTPVLGAGRLSTKLGSPDVHLLKLGPGGHQHRARENSPEKRSYPRPPAFLVELVNLGHQDHARGEAWSGVW